MKETAMDNDKDMIQFLEQRVDDLTNEVAILRSAITVVQETASIVLNTESSVMVKDVMDKIERYHDEKN